jgi:hypothetical protein
MSLAALNGKKLFLSDQAQNAALRQRVSDFILGILSAFVPIVVREIAGRISPTSYDSSPKTLAHYSHVRMDANTR